MNIIIVAENASAKFGGEAILPLHYYRMLKQLGHNVKLVVHERVREELLSLFGTDGNIYYVHEKKLNVILWKMSCKLPKRISMISFGFLMHQLTQKEQCRIIRDIMKREPIDLIHQPTPVSPKEPSRIYGFDCPVIIGPMNGGMDFPPGIKHLKSKTESLFYHTGRSFSHFMNIIIPGKRRATTLLAANERSKSVLPKGIDQSRVKILVENGVDLDLWSKEKKHVNSEITHFVYLGRLVDWKAVDSLLIAFSNAAKSESISLSIIGDGADRISLEKMAANLEILAGKEKTEGKVFFYGWLKQEECSTILNTFDVLVLPSIRECGGAVILEAMAQSMPVISTKWGGPVDYLDEECGILIEPESLEVLQKGFEEAMIMLSRDPELRKKMGRVGRLKVEQEYDWKKKIDIMLDIYGEAIQSS